MTPNQILALPLGHIETNRPRVAWMVLSLIAADAVSLMLAMVATVMMRYATGIEVDLENYLRLTIFFPAFVMAYAAAGLYSGTSLSPQEEIRRTTICSTVVFVMLATLTLSFRGAVSYITVRLLVAILLSAILVPFFRILVRRWLGSHSWWGYRTFIFGREQQVEKLVETLQANPEFGLKPAAVVVDDSATDEWGGHGYCRGVAILSRSSLATTEIPPGTYAIVSPGAEWMLSDRDSRFSHLVVIPEMASESGGLMVGPRSIGVFRGFELRQDIMLPSKRYAKRMLDLTLTLVGGTLLLPLIGILAVAVRLSSPGPVFYSQMRLGRGGRIFAAWKFRSMVVNANECLEQYLAKDPAMRAEWEATHKLREDPRVTPVGRFLRHTSLDELPQLWNVLRGEMSLVGPRPIVPEEVQKYGDCYRSYVRVPGGITGLWQVSGRSNTTYEERVRLDEYYVRNWSVWLDLYILCRTITTVLLREGAC